LNPDKEHISNMLFFVVKYNISLLKRVAFTTQKCCKNKNSKYTEIVDKFFEDIKQQNTVIIRSY
jgi:hypothetical protein